MCDAIRSSRCDCHQPGKDLKESIVSPPLSHRLCKDVEECTDEQRACGVIVANVVRRIRLRCLQVGPCLAPPPVVEPPSML